MRMAALLISGAVILVLGGCGTITKNDAQPVTFNSNPSGALVKIEGVRKARTPAIIAVQRDGENKSVTFEKKGYESQQLILESRWDGTMIAGNLLLWPITGNIVDAITGKATNYQDTMMASLKAE